MTFTSFRNRQPPYMIVYNGMKDMTAFNVVLASDIPIPQPNAPNPDIPQLAVS